MNNLYYLPKSFVVLYCGHNQITQFDNLHIQLEIVDYESNKLLELNNIPPKLSELNYSNNFGLKKINSVVLY